MVTFTKVRFRRHQLEVRSVAFLISSPHQNPAQKGHMLDSTRKGLVGTTQIPTWNAREYSNTSTLEALCFSVSVLLLPCNVFSIFFFLCLSWCFYFLTVWGEMTKASCCVANSQSSRHRQSCAFLVDIAVFCVFFRSYWLSCQRPNSMFDSNSKIDPWTTHCVLIGSA